MHKIAKLLLMFIVSVPSATFGTEPGSAPPSADIQFRAAAENAARCLFQHSKLDEYRALVAEIRADYPADERAMQERTEQYRSALAACESGTAEPPTAVPPAPAESAPASPAPEAPVAGDDPEAVARVARDLWANSPFGATQNGPGNLRVFRRERSVGHVDSIPEGCRMAGNCMRISNLVRTHDGRRGVLRISVNGVEVHPVRAGRPLVALMDSGEVIPVLPIDAPMRVFTPPDDLSIRVTFCEPQGDLIVPRETLINGVVAEIAVPQRVHCSREGYGTWRHTFGSAWEVREQDVPRLL